jgi:hypothetical protein
VILDFDHASEHLEDFAESWHQGDAAAARAAYAAWSHRPKHEGGSALLAWLEGLDIAGNPRAHTAREEGVTGLRDQVRRMDDSSDRAEGWRIGSGRVEAACKTVIGRRMKGSGMRWDHGGADAVCRPRAMLLSEPGKWDAFWANRRDAASSFAHSKELTPGCPGPRAMPSEGAPPPGRIARGRAEPGRGRGAEPAPAGDPPRLVQPCDLAAEAAPLLFARDSAAFARRSANIFFCASLNTDSHSSSD